MILASTQHVTGYCVNNLSTCPTAKSLSLGIILGVVKTCAFIKTKFNKKGDN
jgi:hypothetical protein